MASEEKSKVLWIARTLEILDATEKNAAWLASGAIGFRAWLKSSLRDGKAQLRSVVSDRVMQAQQVLRDRANLQAKKMGIATPKDIAELHQSIDQLRCVLELWLECANDSALQGQVSKLPANHEPETHPLKSATVES